MANYAILKAAISAAIKQNGNNEITGQILQEQLLSMINSLGSGYIYAGVATPATSPGSPDQKIFYVAAMAGTYSNFNGITLANGEVAILKYNGTWSKDSTGVASAQKLAQIGANKSYFAAGGKPIFTNVIINGSASSVTITFGTSAFRIYDGDGSVVIETVAYSGQSFTVASFERLVFDLDTSTVKKVATNATGLYIDLFAVSGESFTGLLVPYYYDAQLKSINAQVESISPLAKRELGMYYFVRGDRPAYFEENTSTGEVFFRYSGILYIRGFVEKSYTLAQLAAELGVSLVTSTKGVANCIAIPNVNNLVFDGTTLTMKLVFRGNLTLNDIPLIITSSGTIIYINQGLFSAYDVNLAMQSNDSTNIVDYYKRLSKEIENAYRNSASAFIFFSDIHAQSVNFQRIISLANSLGTTKIQAIINGGDIVNEVIGEGLEWYNTIVDGSNIPVLNCCGNHDVWSATWQLAPRTTVYNTVIAPMVNRVTGIVQPASAAANGACYYYKDFGNVRVIVLCAMVESVSSQMFWDSAQATWLQGVLDSARQANKSVVCVNHAPFAKADAVLDMDTKWTSYLASDWKADTESTQFDSIHTSEAAVNIVRNFIDAGGKFICWLTGHIHIDSVQINNGQMMINIATANNDRHPDGLETGSISDYIYDCFNYVSFDTTHGFIKILRFGWDMDASLRVRHLLTYDYINRQLVTEN